jgi:hypothetical protein
MGPVAKKAYVLENCPSRMTGKSKVVLKNTILIVKCNTAAYKNHYLSLLNYEICELLTRNICFASCIEVHVRSRPWMSEQPFVLVRCFYTAAYKN